MHVLRPTVEPPRPRLRPSFLVALLLALAAGIVTLLVRTAPHREVVIEATPQPALAGCTPLGVETALRDLQSDTERITCLAVAGQISRARDIIMALPIDERAQAVGPLFGVAHPIADLGDDRSAGPIMKLVVEFWPENYMAVFHAGMAEFALGHDDEAALQLAHFLEIYRPHDIWRDRAQHALDAVAEHTPVDQRQAHFPE